MATTPAYGVPEVINITAPADPCSYVYASETAAQKNAGGTFLDNARYHLCRAGNMLATASDSVVAWFQGEWNTLVAWLQKLWNNGDPLGFGKWLADAAKDLADRIKAALAPGAWVLVAVGLGVLILADDFLS